MTLKWQLLVARSGISKNRLSFYPSQEQSVALCWMLDRRAGFCSRHLTTEACSSSSLLPGGSQGRHVGQAARQETWFSDAAPCDFGCAASRLKALCPPHAIRWPAQAWRYLPSPAVRHRALSLLISPFFTAVHDDSKILCTLKCLGLTIALSLATQRAKWQHIHQPMEGMEGEVG